LAIKAHKKINVFRRLANTTVATVVVLSALSMPAAAQCKKADNFTNPIVAGTSAFFVRKLQSDMMVAALGCGMRQQYNSFATSYQADLKENSSELLSMFAQQFGSQAQRKHTSFLTGMANDASLRMATSVDYSSVAQVALTQLTSNQGLALEKVAISYFSANNIVAKRDEDCPQLTSLPAQ